MSIALDVADTPLGAPWGPPPDINPGKRTPLPLPACEWRTFTRVPPNATVARMIFDHGRAEARAWVDEVWSKQKYKGGEKGEKTQAQRTPLLTPHASSLSLPPVSLTCGMAG